MNIDAVKSAVDLANNKEHESNRRTKLRREAISLGICPDCGLAMRSMTHPLVVSIFETERMRCDPCSTTHKRYYERY